MSVPPRTDLIQPIIDELARREKAGKRMTQAELVKLSGVAQSKVSDILGRKIGRRFVNIERLYSALGLEVRRIKR